MGIRTSGGERVHHFRASHPRLFSREIVFSQWHTLRPSSTSVVDFLCRLAYFRSTLCATRRRDSPDANCCCLTAFFLLSACSGSVPSVCPSGERSQDSLCGSRDGERQWQRLQDIQLICIL